MDDLTDFLENVIYDPALVRFDPDSTTKTLITDEQDLTYSKSRPDLAALSAVDGRMPSGRPRSNDDYRIGRRHARLDYFGVCGVRYPILRFSLYRFYLCDSTRHGLEQTKERTILAEQSPLLWLIDDIINRRQIRQPAR